MARNDMEREPQDYQLKVFPFGTVCSPSFSGYGLRRTAQNNEGLFSPEVIEKVNKNFYLDDCLKSVTDEDPAVSLVPKLGLLLSSGGFHLTKWVSNSSNVVVTIPVVRCHAFSTGNWHQVESRVRHIWFQSEG